MYLVDTSVWIDYFRGRPKELVDSLDRLIDDGAPFGITGIIYQEILQGVSSKADFNKLVTYLETQRFYDPLDLRKTYENAAQIYFECRRKGITIRSTIDCLISQIAIEHDLILLHNDLDYDSIRKVMPELRLLRPSDIA